MPKVVGFSKINSETSQVTFLFVQRFMALFIMFFLVQRSFYNVIEYNSVFALRSKVDDGYGLIIFFLLNLSIFF